MRTFSRARPLPPPQEALRMFQNKASPSVLLPTFLFRAPARWRAFLCRALMFQRVNTGQRSAARGPRWHQHGGRLGFPLISCI